MRKLVKIIIISVVSIMALLINSVPVDAATVVELKERWYDTRYYPIYNGNEEWQKHDMIDTLNIWNPPEDLLLSMPTEELAQLMQEHPCLYQMMTYNDEDGRQDYMSLFMFLELHSDIFYEILRREDGITCLMKEYETNDVNLDILGGEHYVFDTTNTHKWYAELFGCQFIMHYSHCFTDDEYAMASRILAEKSVQYSEKLDEGTLYWMKLQNLEPEPPTGEAVCNIRTNYLTPEEIQEKEDRLEAARLAMQEEVAQEQESEEAESIETQVNDEVALELPEEDSENTGKWLLIVGVVMSVICVVVGGVFVIHKRKQ